MTSKQYNAVAAKYSEVFLECNQESITSYFAHLDFSFEGKRVLDLGCGDGYDLSQLQLKGAQVYGIDSSESMVLLAREKNPQGDIRVGSFEKIPFDDCFFDVVISKWSFQNSSEIDPIYREVSRVLKPRGRFIYLTSHPIRQFLEKKYKGKNYFQKEMVNSIFFEGQISEQAPSHTLNEYLSPTFFHSFEIEAYEEGFDSGAEKVDGDIFPSFFIIKSYRRDT
jgi:ubiquinone/menaquinone biosynthesis C-methylase UbiE